MSNAQRYGVQFKGRFFGVDQFGVVDYTTPECEGNAVAMCSDQPSADMIAKLLNLATTKDLTAFGVPLTMLQALDALTLRLGSSEMPCLDRNNKSCLQNMHGKLSKGKAKLWYGTDCKAATELCESCAAYWHVATARNLVADLLRREQAIEEERKAKSARRTT